MSEHANVPLGRAPNSVSFERSRFSSETTFIYVRVNRHKNNAEETISSRRSWFKGGLHLLSGLIHSNNVQTFHNA